MTASTPQITVRIQVAGNDTADLTYTLRLIAGQIDDGFTSGFHVGTYDFEPVNPASAVEPMDANGNLALLVEVTETTPERIAGTAALIADQIDDGFTSGADLNDEGSYSFVVTRTR